MADKNEQVIGNNPGNGDDIRAWSARERLVNQLQVPPAWASVESASTCMRGLHLPARDNDLHQPFGSYTAIDAC